MTHFHLLISLFLSFFEGGIKTAVSIIDEDDKPMSVIVSPAQRGRWRSPRRG